MVVDDVIVLLFWFFFLLSCDSFFSRERVGRIKERGTCLKLCLTTSAISLLLLACDDYYSSYYYFFIDLYFLSFLYKLY